MTKRLILLLVVVFAVAVNADAQGWLGRLKDKAVDAAKRTVERKVEQKAEDTVDDAMEGKTSKKSKKSDSDDADYEDEEVGDGDEADAVSQNVKNDFKRGETILFEDNMDGEQVGEFPSKWDIVDDGSAEVAVLNGKRYLQFTTEYNRVTPLMTNAKKYLPEVFTLEWDVFVSQSETDSKKFGEMDMFLEFCHAVGEMTYRKSDIKFWWRPGDDGCTLRYSIRKGGFQGDADYLNGDSKNLVKEQKVIKKNAWNHFAVSFNKRGLKVYANGVRIFNIPNMEKPDYFIFFENGHYKYRGFTNVVLAKGGVELYAQQTTDMSAVEKAIAETGKFVTNNILFETGKATLKPESMDEIKKVAEYMKKNPTARFEVQGHTDNQGSDAINDPLSQQRAEAVVKALEELGCDPFNMRAVGKGSHEPVADNKTDEGRAKNRRVEFIKK